jgi:uncharacterized protein (TIGR03118 family)
MVKAIKQNAGLLAAFALAAVGTVINAPSNARAAGYLQTNLVSNGTVSAPNIDPNLSNPWGMAFFPGGPFWVADNNTGVSTLYDGLGNILPLVVSIPIPPGTTFRNSAPSGIVANTNPTLFLIPGSSEPALFIFDSEDGSISAWNDMVNATAAVTVVNNSQGGSNNGAVYKGLAIGNNASGTFLYAANFRSGKIDVFDSTFAPATLTGNFIDSTVPAGFAPYNVANVNGNLVVTWAKQNAAKNNPVAGAGLGFVSIFDTNGNLIASVPNGSELNEPWGVALAPFNFGKFSSTLLIGNLGDGKINAFSLTSKAFLGQLTNPSNKPIAIKGLWTLAFGGAQSSDPGTLYFVAGTNGYQDGLFGTLTPQ